MARRQDEGFTRSQDESTHADGPGGLVACLTLAFDAEQPLRPPARAVLAGDRVVLGRGQGPFEVTGEVLPLDDGFVSTTHARLERAMGTWVLSDAGSKNGTRVNGAPVERQVLADGDVVELGRSFLVYRAGVPAAELAARGTLAGLTTLQPRFGAALARLQAVVKSGVSVLLHGEVGTGKEVAARAVHAASGRSGAFIAVNCGAIPEALVEGELFGHKKGAFSGATDDRPGLLRSADGGTLFLDELGELPLRAQVALLRVLQEREVVAVGATRPVPVELRVVAATHRDLEAMVVGGQFRADLHSRLLGFQLELPPLCERREDLGALIAALIRRYGGGEGVKLHIKAARSLFARRFAANVRELEKLLQTALALAGDGRLLPEHLPGVEQVAVPARDDDGTPRERLEALLLEHKGNIRGVARAMGKAPVQIRRWLRRFGLDAATYKG